MNASQLSICGILLILSLGVPPLGAATDVDPDIRATFRKLTRDYHRTGRTLDNQIRAVAERERGESTTPEDYRVLMQLQSDRDRLYSRLTLLSLRYDLEVPRDPREHAENGDIAQPALTPTQAFADGRLLILSHLEEDAHLMARAAVHEKIPPMNCVLSGSESGCDICEWID